MPEVVLLPDQAPLAVQPVALVEDQVKVDALPAFTLVGLAERVTVGAGVGVGVGVVDGGGEMLSLWQPTRPSNSRPRHTDGGVMRAVVCLRGVMFMSSSRSNYRTLSNGACGQR